MTQAYLEFKKGDVIAPQTPSGNWFVTKIIAIDRYPNGIPATALGDFAAAESIFMQGLTRFPDRAADFTPMLQLTRSNREQPSSDRDQRSS